MSTVPFVHITVSIPNASAVLIIVPIFPASCILSKISTFLPLSTNSFSGIPITANIPCGVFVSEILSNTSCEKYITFFFFQFFLKFYLHHLHFGVFL